MNTFLLFLFMLIGGSKSQYVCSEVEVNDISINYSYRTKANISIDIEDSSITIINHNLKDTAVVDIAYEIQEDTRNVSSYMAYLRGEPVMLQTYASDGKIEAIGIGRGKDLLVFRLVQQLIL